jgi:hypothetical protein
MHLGTFTRVRHVIVHLNSFFKLYLQLLTATGNVIKHVFWYQRNIFHHPDWRSRRIIKNVPKSFETLRRAACCPRVEIRRCIGLEVKLQAFLMEVSDVLYALAAASLMLDVVLRKNSVAGGNSGRPGCGQTLYSATRPALRHCQLPVTTCLIIIKHSRLATFLQCFPLS